MSSSVFSLGFSPTRLNARFPPNIAPHVAYHMRSSYDTTRIDAAILVLSSYNIRSHQRCEADI
jgi:hypothetical protein